MFHFLGPDDGATEAAIAVADALLAGVQDAAAAPAQVLNLDEEVLQQEDTSLALQVGLTSFTHVFASMYTSMHAAHCTALRGYRVRYCAALRVGKEWGSYSASVQHHTTNCGLALAEACSATTHQDHSPVCDFLQMVAAVQSEEALLSNLLVLPGLSEQDAYALLSAFGSLSCLVQATAEEVMAAGCSYDHAMQLLELWNSAGQQVPAAAAALLNVS